MIKKEHKDTVHINFYMNRFDHNIKHILSILDGLIFGALFFYINIDFSLHNYSRASAS